MLYRIALNKIKPWDCRGKMNPNNIIKNNITVFTSLLENALNDRECFRLCPPTNVKSNLHAWSQLSIIPLIYQ